MNLEERIARLIDPTAWIKADTCREVGWPDERYEQKSRAAARRVIDGFHLDIISSRHGLDGLRRRYDLSGFIRGDMSERSRARGEGDAHRPERCPTCGCELAYPTAVHVVDSESQVGTLGPGFAVGSILVAVEKIGKKS